MLAEHMNMTVELLVIIFMLVGMAYWLDGMRCKEIARDAGKKSCNEYELVFLDDTVVLVKIRLHRDNSGRMKLYRQYQFEFTSGGDYRYKGKVIMLGKYVININMDAYHVGV